MTLPGKIIVRGVVATALALGVGFGFAGVASAHPVTPAYHAPLDNSPTPVGTPGPVHNHNAAGPLDNSPTPVGTPGPLH